MNRRAILSSSSALLGVSVICLFLAERAEAVTSFDVHYRVVHSDAEWGKLLSPASYDVLREGGTELPFTSPLLYEERTGIFKCAGCALPLYSSATKYDSGTGWPSFWDHLPGAILTSQDDSFGMVRTGSALQSVRRPSGASFSRWSEAHRPSLLHERCRSIL